MTEKVRPLDKSQEPIHDGLFEAVRDAFQVDFVTGLPCGELRSFIRQSDADSRVMHVPATNERESVGIAAGAWLGGKKPALYMQNSGLFEASNDIASLIIASKIPVALVVSWRGAPGETATQHLTTGSATKGLLSSFGIEYTDTASAENLKSLKDHMLRTRLPICILQRRGVFNTQNDKLTQQGEYRSMSKVIEEGGSGLSSRDEILSVIAKEARPSTAIISSTGLISRSMYHNHDSANQFYNAGGFGLTSSVGLGLALTQQDRRVVVVEGDGSVLTNLGNLNLIGYYQPKNLLHIVLDNQVYASCSGEPTIGPGKIPALAGLLGYKGVFSVSSSDSVVNVMRSFQFNPKGPVMLHVRINNVGPRDFSRPLEMTTTAERLRSHLGS